jgi:hypothetical protein
MNAVDHLTYVLDPKGLRSVEGTIKYGALIEGVELYHYDTIDFSRTNLKLLPRVMQIFDIKGRKEQLSYHSNGFALCHHESEYADLANSEQINSHQYLEKLRDSYQEEMTAFLRGVSGTPHVFPQHLGFFVRHGSKSKLKTSQKPASLPHKDFTVDSANEMSELIRVKQASGRRFRGFAIYQTWRTVTPPPQDNFLCFCDPQTVANSDMRVVESTMGPRDVPGNVFRMEMALYNSAHRWFYFSGLDASDVIIFQGYDPTNPMPILHTSFDNPEPGASPRVSIECRHYAFFE